MSANRSGKREREARNLSKRCRVTLQLNGVGLTLKLGRKKAHSLCQSESLVDTGNGMCFDYLSPPHQVASWAVPVADSRTPVKTDEGDAHVSELV
jgi:hypothetical protein